MEAPGRLFQLRNKVKELEYKSEYHLMVVFHLMAKYPKA